MDIKVALDAQSLFESNKTGIGWTIKKLIDHLTAIPEFQYQLNYFGRYRVKGNESIIQEYLQKGCTVKHCSWMELPVYRRIWNLLPVPYRWMFGADSSITQFFNYVIPPGVCGKKVLYIYDMAYKAYPDTISKRTRADLSRNLERSCKRADIICTISEFSKKEIIKYLGVTAEKIRVIPCGVDHNLFHSQQEQHIISSVKEKYKIKGPYFLYLGTLEPRKNVLRIVKAYSQLLKKEKKCPQLVLAGKKGWLYDDIFALVMEEKMEDRVVFTGYVETDEVPVLMAGAYAFLFPSLYEGFGLPVLEAMACGTPVITSSVSSLPEVAGDAAILVNPENENEIAMGMERVLEEEGLRDEMIIAGLKQCQRFTWQHSAECLEMVYHELI